MKMLRDRLKSGQEGADAVQVDHILSLTVSLGLSPHLVNTAVFTKEVKWPKLMPNRGVYLFLPGFYMVLDDFHMVFA